MNTENPVSKSQSFKQALEQAKYDAQMQYLRNVQYWGLGKRTQPQSTMTKVRLSIKKKLIRIGEIFFL